MKGFNFKEKFSKSKSIYTMAAVSFCLAALAIGIVYSQTMSNVKKIIPELSTTKQVHQNQTDVDDPRTTVPASTKKEEPSTKPSTTKASTTETTTATSEPASTTEAVAISSTAVSVIASQSFIRPHDGEIIKAYSPDVPVYCETMNDWRTHGGIDIAVKEGDEAVSVGKGKVSKVIADSSYGYTVEVDYGTFTARYCGMKQGECVGIEQSLEKGDSIGVIDTVPCEAKSAPHLHFEVLVAGEQVDPLKMIG